MRREILAAALVLVSPALWAAAASAPAATQPAPAASEDEHAGHGQPVGAGGMAGTVGAGNPAVWTSFPTLKTRMSGTSRERRVITVVPQGMVASRIDAYSNNLEDTKAHRQLPLDMAGGRLDKPESGGFHWLAAREEQDGRVWVASTMHFSSEGGDQNPTAMFMQQKYELEIIPQPYPREHSRYRANEDWKFLVRFNGKPLVNQKLDMETANGSRTEYFSDAQGLVTLRIPDDFKVVQENAEKRSRGRRSADFVVATEHVEAGKNYLTAFNASYGTDAFEQRSLAMGLGFTLLGMIGAVPLLRQRKPAKRVSETVKNKDA